jgi:hypothetical protein
MSVTLGKGRGDVYGHTVRSYQATPKEAKAELTKHLLALRREIDEALEELAESA